MNWIALLRLATGVRPNLLRALSVSLAAGLLAGCVSTGPGPVTAEKTRPNLSKKVVQEGSRVPKGGGHYKIGRPYQIANKWYRPSVDRKYDRVGIASWYGVPFHGRKTANGEIFDMDSLTAAHPTLPLPVLARVTNLENGRSLVVRINDRGPYRHNRIIDLSRKTATQLGFKHKGTARVRVQYMRDAPLNGDDRYERKVLANADWNRPAGQRAPGNQVADSGKTSHAFETNYESTSANWPYAN
jgi:rare lipoprotein A